MVDGIVSTQYRLLDSNHKKLKHICEKERRSMNAQIDFYVIKGIEEYEKQHGKIDVDTKEK